MTAHPAKPAWALDFNNERRHCWYVPAASIWMLEGDARDRTCHTWKDHAQRRGNVPWLRFIRAFADQLDPTENPFHDEAHFALLNETDGHTTSDGRLTYAETYLRRHTDDWGLDPVMRVFLANDAGWARIECYEEELIEACQMALASVAQSYTDEEEAMPA